MPCHRFIGRLRGVINRYIRSVTRYRSRYDLSPEEVLFTVQEIERELGSKKHREGDGSYVDRLIDIDLLDYDGLVLDTHSLVLPHRICTSGLS